MGRMRMDCKARAVALCKYQATSLCCLFTFVAHAVGGDVSIGGVGVGGDVSAGGEVVGGDDSIGGVGVGGVVSVGGDGVGGIVSVGGVVIIILPPSSWSILSHKSLSSIVISSSCLVIVA
jgi:hypothetical protein